jgi:hypothetical protein
LLSVFFIWESFRKVTYRCRELALTLVSLQKKSRLPVPILLSLRSYTALAIAPMPALCLQTLDGVLAF